MELRLVQRGRLVCIKKPWPGMMRFSWGDPERFKLLFQPFPGLLPPAAMAPRKMMSGTTGLWGVFDDVNKRLRPSHRY
jgi:acyl-coenzyme A synthetase/AMP-(fatty) acid ligase